MIVMSCYVILCNVMPTIISPLFLNEISFFSESSKETSACCKYFGKTIIDQNSPNTF